MTPFDKAVIEYMEESLANMAKALRAIERTTPAYPQEQIVIEVTIAKLKMHRAKLLSDYEGFKTAAARELRSRN